MGSSSSLVLLRAQRREQDHVADRRRAGHQHHQPVDADPEAAGRRQAVLERADVVLVDVLGLVVAGRLRARLGLEALALVDGVVELAVGVGQLAAGDDRLEALDQRVVVAVHARQRGDLARVVHDERRRDQRVLDGLVVDLGDQPPRAPARLVRDPEPVADRARLLDRHRRMHPHAGVLVHEVGHRRAPPRRREVDRAPLDVDHRGAGRGERRLRADRLDQLHHVVVVAERLVGLEQRELGVVAGVEPLVAEHAADLEHALEAADHEPLERQLERDPHVHVEVERVVVGHERPRGGAARVRVEHRRLDLREAALDQHPPHGRDHRRADVERPPRLRVDDQVEVALRAAAPRGRPARGACRAARAAPSRAA